MPAHVMICSHEVDLDTQTRKREDVFRIVVLKFAAILCRQVCTRITYA